MKKVQQLLRDAFSATELTNDQLLHCQGLVDTLCRTVLLWHEASDLDDYKYLSHLLVVFTGLSLEHFLLKLLPSSLASTYLEAEVQPSKNPDLRLKKEIKNIASTVKGFQVFTNFTQKSTKKKRKKGPIPSSCDQQGRVRYKCGVTNSPTLNKKMDELLEGVECLKTQQVIRMIIGCRDVVQLAVKHINLILATVFAKYEDLPLKIKDSPIPLDMVNETSTSQRRVQHVLDSGPKKNFPALCQSLRILLDLTSPEFDPFDEDAWEKIKGKRRGKIYMQTHKHKHNDDVLSDSRKIFEGLDEAALIPYVTTNRKVLGDWVGMKAWKYNTAQARNKVGIEDEASFPHILTCVFLKYRDIRSRPVVGI